MEKDYKIHLGIVIQNNDPEMRGRVKVYVPILSPTIKGIEVGDNTNVDKFFNFLGKNNEASNVITDNIKNLKDVLPWAEYAGPICGGNASGRYNATLKTGTTSDANTWENDAIVEGFRPAQNFVAGNTEPDAFAETEVHKNKFVNQYAYQYTPSNYSGFARGLFSIPNVGSHVYIFFMDGDRNFPVYFASSYSQEDIKRIFTLNQDVNVNSNIDYPATYENIDKNNPSDDTIKTFRSKTVLNSNKHTLEFIDTDLHEIIKLTHYAGSFKEFNNYSTTEFAHNNDQKLVKGDKFLTVNRNNSEYVKHHKELIVGGDHYINIGETNYAIVKDILNIHKEIHDYKMLFDVQRAEYGKLAPNNLSTKQKRTGKFEVCPICKGIPYDPYDTFGGTVSILDNWKEAPKYIDRCVSTSTETTTDAEGAASEAEDSSIWTTDCHSIYLASISDEETASNTECVPTVHAFSGKIGYYKGIKCACCNGTNLPNGLVANPGFSPSTENGSWTIDPAKQPNGALDQLIKSKTPELFELEKMLGKGGDEIKNVSMNKIETIGMVMNDLPSFRVDPIGKLKIDGCWVASQGTYENFRPSPHVEYVDVADIPGGDYILTCMNKYKLLVGSRGINMQTTGPIDIYGSIVNFNGEQVNISSKNEVVIDGGERLTLRARKITALPVEHNAFVVEGLLHVTRNAIIQGGMMLEGEVGLLHITAPLEWQETEHGLWDAQYNENCSMTAMIAGIPTPVVLPHHTHWFKNVPLTLLQHKEAVRETMIEKGINSRNSIAAASVASNPSGTCDTKLWSKVSSAWLAVAKTAAQAAYESLTDNTDKISDLAVNGPNSFVCTTTNEGEDSEITEINAVYNWYWRGKGGNITISGKVKSDGTIVSAPKA
jgi:hypothetical protein